MTQQGGPPTVERGLQAIQTRIVQDRILNRAGSQGGVSARLKCCESALCLSASLARIRQSGAQACHDEVVGICDTFRKIGQAEIAGDCAALLAFFVDQAQQLGFSQAQISGPVVRAIDFLGLHPLEEGGRNGVDDLGKPLRLRAARTQLQQVGVGYCADLEQLSQALNRASFWFIRLHPQSSLSADPRQSFLQNVTA